VAIPAMSPAIGHSPTGSAAEAPASERLQQGRQQFEAGEFPAAIATLERALRAAQQQGNLPLQATVLSNLGYVQFEIGQPTAALTSWQQAAGLYQQIGDRGSEIRSLVNQAEALQALGESRKAVEQLNRLKTDLDQQPDSLEKARVLRSLATVLLSVGDTVDERRPFNPQDLFQVSLAIATKLQSPPDVSAAALGLGNAGSAELRNTLRIEFNPNRPIAAKLTTAVGLMPSLLTILQDYQTAIAQAPTAATTVQAQLNQLNLLVNTLQVLTQLPTETEAPPPSDPRMLRLQDAVTQLSTYVLALVPQLPVQIDRLPASRSAIYARINFANTLLKLKHPPSETSPLVLLPQASPLLPKALPSAAQLLAQAVTQARTLGDRRAEAYALGTLAGLYERTNQLPEAEQLTQQALFLAQSINAPDIAYQWQWQLARVLQNQGKNRAALKAFDACVKTLEPLRKNLAAINQDVQFDFRDTVAPIYRQYVSLLLNSIDPTAPNQATLETARQQIENLQLAELDNFFRAACLEGRKVDLDRLVDQNPTTAFIYPIVLADLQVIVKLPKQTQLRYVRTELPENLDLDQLLSTLRQQLTDVTAAPQARLDLSGQVYDWLIAPFDAAFQAQGVDTLVFVLDGSLRDVPMAALYNRAAQKYLIEDYAIAVSPALQLVDPKPIAQTRLNVLTAGLIQKIPETRYSFSPLPAVAEELQRIRAANILTHPPLLEEQFSTAAFTKTLNANPFNVVHLATHGQFSSRKGETFILTYDGALDVDRLSEILRNRERTRPEAIELLVLSACQTAKGDNRAALGLAGMAIKAGARSTLASLWTVVDQSTAVLVGKFYTELATAKLTKAKALQAAQLELLRNNPDYADPRFWAPYILVGNWL
jgi:CHAT domain-containing protein